MKTPTKQTVYLPVKVENASGNHIPDNSVLLVKEQYELDKYWENLVKPQEGYFFTAEELNEYTESVIKQAIDTAEEAELAAIVKLIEIVKKQNLNG
jgi:hypothetical protein